MRIPWLAAAVVAADQLTKHWAVASLKPVGSIPVIPGLFSLSYVENPGAAWGMLAGRQFFLIGFSLATLAFLLWRRRDLFGPLWGGSVTLSLIAGGVVGNLIDRVRLGEVIDFLDVYWKTHHWPAFNVADSAICVGVALLALDMLREERRRPRDI
jgi:signal peptidase II